MASIVPRAMIRASRTPISLTTRRMASQSNATQEQIASSQAMKKEAKRNPELYILMGVMTSAFAFAGWHFTRNPTTAGKESSVAKIEGSEPWNTGKEAPYQYHPYGDPSEGKKDAPSALHVTIIDKVNLPKELHDRFNKYGKDEYS